MLALPECPVYCTVPAVETKTPRPPLRLLGLASIVVRGGGLVATSYEYGVAVILLAIFASVNLIRLASRNSSSSTKEISR